MVVFPALMEVAMAGLVVVVDGGGCVRGAAAAMWAVDDYGYGCVVAHGSFSTKRPSRGMRLSAATIR